MKGRRKVFHTPLEVGIGLSGDLLAPLCLGDVEFGPYGHSMSLRSAPFAFYWNLLFLRADAPILDRERLKEFLDQAPQWATTGHRCVVRDVDPGSAVVAEDRRTLQSLGFVSDATEYLIRRDHLSQVRPKPWPHSDCRTFQSKDDWSQALRNRCAANQRWPRAPYRAAITERMSAYRHLQELGCGHWYGLFGDEGRLHCDLGLFATPFGGRYAMIFTADEARGRGAASSLIEFAAQHFQDERGPTPLIIGVAGTNRAQDLFRRRGFLSIESREYFVYWPAEWK